MAFSLTDVHTSPVVDTIGTSKNPPQAHYSLKHPQGPLSHALVAFIMYCTHFHILEFISDCLIYSQANSSVTMNREAAGKCWTQLFVRQITE